MSARITVQFDSPPLVVRPERLNHESVDRWRSSRLPPTYFNDNNTTSFSASFWRHHRGTGQSCVAKVVILTKVCLRTSSPATAKRVSLLS